MELLVLLTFWWSQLDTNQNGTCQRSMNHKIFDAYCQWFLDFSKIESGKLELNIEKRINLLELASDNWFV
jgi:hypothetical protein